MQLRLAIAEKKTEICAIDGARIEWGTEGLRFGVAWCCTPCAAKPESIPKLKAADARERMLRELLRPGSKSGRAADRYLGGDERALGAGANNG